MDGLALEDGATADWLHGFGEVGTGIDQDGDQPGINVGLTMEQEQTSLGGDGDLYLIGEFESAAALEHFFTQEDLHQALELVAIGFWKALVKWDVPFDDLPEGLGKRPRSQPLAPSLFEEAEHDLILLSGFAGRFGS